MRHGKMAMHNAAHYRLVLLSYLVDSVLIPWGWEWWDNSLGGKCKARCATDVRCEWVFLEAWLVSVRR